MTPEPPSCRLLPVGGIESYFDWSFYSQGTRREGDAAGAAKAASADLFFKEALEFFGDPDLAASNAGAWQKGERLAQLAAQRRTLLILDGLESLQHPPGPLAGQLRDPALAALLRGLAQRNPGLCLVTTRERVADLAPFRDTTTPVLELQHLSTPAGVELLKTLGVWGTAVEFQHLVEDVAGHALTLNLLGRYLAKAHGGDIRRRDEVKFEKADAKVQGGHAFKTMAAYEKWREMFNEQVVGHEHAFKTMAAYEKWLLEGGEDGARQLAVLRLLGLFDRPADAGCLEALRREPAIPGLTGPLVGLDEDDWICILSDLADCGLVSVQKAEGSQPSTLSSQPPLDAHPLIREYFAGQLRQQNPAGWRAAHGRLYEHLVGSTSDKGHPVLEDLQPLYQAVAHGCRAGRFTDALVDVFQKRLRRGVEHYSFRRGFVGADLAALSGFFDTPWLDIKDAPAVSNQALSALNQAYVLNETGSALRVLGRIHEAAEPVQASLDLLEKEHRWLDAASASNTLVNVLLLAGHIKSARHAAERGVDFADRSEHMHSRTTALITLARVLHYSGDIAHAFQLLDNAVGMEPAVRTSPRYGLQSASRCELLVDAGRFQEAEEQAGTMLRRLDEERQPREVALHCLLLGSACLRRAGTGVSSDFGKASEFLHRAVEGTRKASRQDELPPALLCRSYLGSLMGNAVGARADLDEAWQIAERGPMRLHLADIHLHRARLFFREEPYPWTSPQADLAAARQLIEQCGYGRRKEELEDAEEAVRNHFQGREPITEQ
ncbi:MAG: hypothetical protein AAB676_06565 [Verrucomicrobiota bacterium]